MRAPRTLRAVAPAVLAMALVSGSDLLAQMVRIPSTRDLGKAEGRCRPDEPGPAILVDALGLKDRKGLLKLEVYPANDQDFLADDNVLVSQGKVFRRVEETTPHDGPVVLCIRVPGPGVYSVLLLHDRDSNHKFGWWEDGVGFPGNPRLGWHKPKAEQTQISAGPGLTRTAIVLNYRHGLGMAPLRQKD